MSSKKNPLLFSTPLLIVIGFAVGLLLVEGYLRTKDVFQSRGTKRKYPIIQVADETLGWRLKPGTYLFPPLMPRQPEIVISIDQEGKRIYPRIEQATSDNKLFIAGCSFSFGWSLPDEANFAAHLQSHTREAEVINLAVPGYGTHQSALRVKQYLTAHPPKGRFTVLYGLIDDHPPRNVGSVAWRVALAKQPGGIRAEAPFCRLAPDLVCETPGSLLESPPIPRFLSASFASVGLLENYWISSTQQKKDNIAEPVTFELLREFAHQVESRGGRFVTVILKKRGPDWMKRFNKFFTQNKMTSLDCSAGAQKEWRIAGDGHPDARANQFWADCLSRNLKKIL